VIFCIQVFVLNSGIEGWRWVQSIPKIVYFCTLYMSFYKSLGHEEKD
jgi:hypothetical protein